MRLLLYLVGLVLYHLWAYLYGIVTSIYVFVNLYEVIIVIHNNVLCEHGHVITSSFTDHSMEFLVPIGTCTIWPITVCWESYKGHVHTIHNQWDAS